MLGTSVLALCAGLWFWTAQVSRNEGEPSRAKTTIARFPTDGRLTVDEDALPTQGSLLLRLPLPLEAIGDTPRPIRIASTDGRSLETTGERSAASKGEIEFDLDLHWLRAGRYLVEVKTAEKTPLAVRRFTLEVR